MYHEHTRKNSRVHRARGAIQLSRRYRTIGVPPVLAEGQTYRALAIRRNPSFAGCPALTGSEESSAQTLATYSVDCHVELTFDEFSEWLKQRGLKGLAKPPKPFETWYEYHEANGTLRSRER